jgi:hypothetical protein
LFKPYIFRLSSVLSILGVHAIVSTSTLVLEVCFSLLVMFDALFYLCMLSCVIVDNTPFEKEKVQRFEEKESNFWLEKVK